MRETDIAPAILAISTSVPDTCITPGDYINFMTELLSLKGRKAAILYDFVKRIEIKKRYSVIQDFKKPSQEWQFFDNLHPSNFPSTEKRNNIYKKEALTLSYSSSQKALEEWGRPRNEITHIIYVSCTGLQAPGIECLLVNRLKLSPTVNRLAINFMGCFGAFRAISVASAIATQNLSHRILIVCTELCSLHAQPDLKVDTIISNALFGDGSASMVIGSRRIEGEQALWEVERCSSAIIDNCQKAMTWDLSNHGFVMRLGSKVPKLFRHHIAKFASSLLDSKTDASDADWPVHPGGKAILKAIEEECKLSREQTQCSWDIISNFGNLSSATFPFVLDLLRKQKRLPWAVGLGFGPGLSMEGILLKKIIHEKSQQST